MRYAWLPDFAADCLKLQTQLLTVAKMAVFKPILKQHSMLFVVSFGNK
jgi:hypothetical protein